jgi:CheY-like chemotaxis protein
MNEELKKISILYVEDDDFIRENTCELLKNIFKDVFVAKNGKEGVYAYNQHSKEVSAIITDVNMPELSGLEMAKVINKMKKVLNTDTPIIAVSAYSCEDYGFSDVQENFSHYLKKPIKIKDLISSVDMAIKGEKGKGC